MKFNLLYLLPLLALAIALFNPAFRPDTRAHYRSARSKHRHVLKSILARGAVFALLLASFVTYRWPMSALPGVAQGVMLTILFMIPVLICWLLFKLLWRTSNKSVEQESNTDIQANATSAVIANSANLAPAQHDPVNPVEPLDPLEPVLSVKTSSAPLTTSQDTTTTKEDPIEAMEEKATQSGRNAVQLNAQTLTVGNASNDQPLFDDDGPIARANVRSDMQDEMDNVGDLVDYHELDTEESDYDLDEQSNSRTSTVETAIALAQEGFAKHQAGMPVTQQGQLAAPSQGELKQLISTLQSDKLKLQKLVIAQQAAIDSERLAHERTRTVAKDAIKIMRDARHGQRVAEKIARRERTQRQRIERDYDKVRSTLDNAMSTLRTESPLVDSYEL